ncbi:MAG: glycosyltransferase family 2 protein [Fibrobacter sp.]|jgi:glycosyltransferase involved in cell wall biosynthesis|nr:glycosyltransferase family 2 protein [Fibrobacter sp.]
MEKLVSILTPCYNGEKLIWRLLDSILAQTYPRIEMFIIDDGSMDRSAEVIQSYIPRFESRGYSLTYIYQKNSGQSVAINNGLKLITGDYFVWPDSDDWYAVSDAIQQMVGVLEASDDSVSMVRCEYCILDENTLEKLGTYEVNEQTKGKTDLFTDCLFEQNGYWFAPGGYMAKAKKIEETIPGKEIYTDQNAGQNWQLMLPLLYGNKCLTIENFLYNYLVRTDSHSRGQYSSLEQLLLKYNTHENTILATIDKIENMPVTERRRYQRVIRLKYAKLRFETGVHFRDAKTIKENANIGVLKIFLIQTLKKKLPLIRKKIFAQSQVKR